MRYRLTPDYCMCANQKPFNLATSQDVLRIGKIGHGAHDQLESGKQLVLLFMQLAILLWGVLSGFDLRFAFCVAGCFAQTLFVSLMWE